MTPEEIDGHVLVILDAVKREDPTDTQKVAALGACLNLLGQVIKDLGRIAAAQEVLARAIWKP